MSPHSVINDSLKRDGSAFVNHPADRGKATRHGITAGTLAAYRKAPVSVDDVRNLTEDEARAIYKSLYLERPKISEIRDVRLRGLMMDCAVHSGPAKAITWLQQALGVAADGVIGPMTLNAVHLSDMERTYDRVLAQRLKFLGRLITNDPSQAAFAAGWMNRCAEFLES